VPKAVWFRSGCARGAVVHAMHSVPSGPNIHGGVQYSHGTARLFVRRRSDPPNDLIEALSAVVNGTYAVSGPSYGLDPSGYLRIS
jgi:hypothetical protein